MQASTLKCSQATPLATSTLQLTPMTTSALQPSSVSGKSSQHQAPSLFSAWVASSLVAVVANQHDRTSTEHQFN
jgi:hypothetical protein